MHKVMDDLFEATSGIDYVVVADVDEYRKIVEIDIKIAEALQERDGERAYYLQFERDRVITRIISEDENLMNATYQLYLSVKTN